MIYGGHFDVDSKRKELLALEEELTKCYGDYEKVGNITSKISSLKKIIDSTVVIKDKITSNIGILDSMDEVDSEMLNLLEEDSTSIKEMLSSLEISLMLNGPYDNNAAILEVHSGAGGTEACDWAEMLFRMYNRFASSKNYKVEVLDVQAGLDAGIKSASIMVSGAFAYGYLKCEKGVHRLVRLSPFDSAHKRHTSFASVDVTPVFSNTASIELNPNDLKIDVYRSTGAGGQGVNTTDSAVRVTYLPLKIVVTCQNERSQIKNKEKAIEILKNKLKLIEIEKQEEKLNAIKGDNTSNAFGSQIRSYVMHPYSMVKDHRTNIETSNVSKVLDGDIDMFIEGVLRKDYGKK